MKRLWKVVLPIVVVLFALSVAIAMILSREQPVSRIVEPPDPLIRVQVVETRDVTLSVTSQGTVKPRTVSTLVPEVAGRVIEMAPEFEPGGFFEANDVLLRIDPFDYRQALIEARARVALAELRLAQQRAEAEVAREEWEDLGQGDASPLALYEPQLAEAEAARDAALAAVERAERNLERTAIRAPYAGRVREKLVDRGQVVGVGTPLGTVYAIDYAEVRLPLPDDELAFVELPLDYRGLPSNGSGPRVVLRADFAGQVHEWHGRIVRTEGEIDPRSRMVHAVARVEDPYGGAGEQRPPLASGLFVEAEIQGRRVDNAVVLPRMALRGDDRVWVVNEENRLRFRQVEVVRATGQEVILASGLQDGERVCLSTLPAVTDGMRVRTTESEEGS